MILGKKIAYSEIAACARVALTTLMFTLAHSMPPEFEADEGFASCSISRLGHIFVQGLIMSTIQEVAETIMQELTESYAIPLTGSTASSMVYHTFANLPGFILRYLKKS